LFNSKAAQEINRKLVLYLKLREQQEEIRKREEQAELERIKIEEWWEEEKKKIVPWTPEQRAFYTKFTFSSDEKTSESWIRSQTNKWKKLENR
jgi:hypothetical protein